MVWIYLHPTASCFLFVLLPVFQMIFKSASWVIFLLAALAALRCTNWCLHCCCVLISNVCDEAPAHRLDLDLLGRGCGGSESMICWCGIGEEDDNEMK